VDPRAFEFVATVLQEDADYVFQEGPRGAEVRVKGQAAVKQVVEKWRVIPGEQRLLPSPALGFRGGGEVAVAMDDEHGNKAAEPYFKVLAQLPAQGEVALFDGISGQIRFDLKPEPLLSGWLRRLWQLLQKRYQV
jgi:putative peptide zinc metalloprotease protein